MKSPEIIVSPEAQHHIETQIQLFAEEYPKLKDGKVLLYTDWRKPTLGGLLSITRMDTAGGSKIAVHPLIRGVRGSGAYFDPTDEPSRSLLDHMLHTLRYYHRNLDLNLSEEFRTRVQRSVNDHRFLWYTEE